MLPSQSTPSATVNPAHAKINQKRQNTPIAFDCALLPDVDTDNGGSLSAAAQCAPLPDIHTATATAVTQQQQQETSKQQLYASATILHGQGQGH